jgi:hypothetical protein
MADRQRKPYFHDMDTLVTVRTFTYAHEAGLAKSLLESEGIFCFLKDELTIQANPFYSNALGGVKLQVRAEDAHAAVDILKRAGYMDPEPDKTITIKRESGEISECPACESEEISLIRKPSKPLFGLSLALLGFPLTTFSSMYHCWNCGRDIKVMKG